MMLQACMGLEVDATARTVLLSNARLPDFLDDLRIENVAVGETRVDLRLQREGDGVGIEVLARSGEISVVNVR